MLFFFVYFFRFAFSFCLVVTNSIAMCPPPPTVDLLHCCSSRWHLPCGTVMSCLARKPSNRLFFAVWLASSPTNHDANSKRNRLSACVPNANSPSPLCQLSQAVVGWLGTFDFHPEKSPQLITWRIVRDNLGRLYAWMFGQVCCLLVNVLIWQFVWPQTNGRHTYLLSREKRKM